MSERYAVFYTPPKGSPLLALAHSWLGRDAFSGAPVPVNSNLSLSEEEILDFASFPRLYGFHATLKAPFRLKDGVTVDELHSALDVWAATEAPVAVPSIVLTRMGQHFALMPKKPVEYLNKLAEGCLLNFEPFRAELSEAEDLRRKPAALTDVQRAYLFKYGYPYVLDEFRFHMTLTRTISDWEASTVEAALREHFAGVLEKPLAVNGIGLFSQAEPGANFTVQHYAPLLEPTERSQS